MTQALAERGHDITFVLPRLKQGMTSRSHVNLISVDDVPPVMSSGVNGVEARVLEGLAGRVAVQALDSPLRPYMTDRTYHEMLHQLAHVWQGELPDLTDVSPVDVSGDYGPNLIEEIFRYAKAAGAIAAHITHDIIHAHDWLTFLAGMEAKKVSGKPLVVHIHALEFDRSGEHINQLVYDIERQGMEGADLVVAVSHYTKGRIVGRYGLSPERIKVVHNAVTRRESPLGGRGDKQNKDKVVLFLGRITFQKGPDYFIEAARKVLERKEHVRFVMAGSGDMAPRMIERVAELGIGRKFHFTGFLKGQELERMFLESDIYVMPSVSEPFGISPLEAMHYDVPVIISNQSGVSEVLTHALKFDFWNVDDLADKIIAMLDHSPLREEILAQGAKEVQRLQWSNAATQLGDIYQRVAGTA
jgi:glycosyltransferase involved in cell wall biosynthesis